jgi:hypothetical protein
MRGGLRGDRCLRRAILGLAFKPLLKLFHHPVGNILGRLRLQKSDGILDAGQNRIPRQSPEKIRKRQHGGFSLEMGTKTTPPHFRGN